MDQGLAALIAGVAGTVGALGGAIAGGVGAVRGARIGAEKTADALHKQTQDQAEIEHRHWAREQRRLACSNAMEAHSALTWAMVQCAMPLERGELPDRDDHMTLDRAAQPLPRAAQQLQLWGPPELASAAAELVGRDSSAVLMLKRWVKAIEDGASADASELATNYSGHSDWLGEAYVTFVRVAGEVLRDPSSNH